MTHFRPTMEPDYQEVLEVFGKEAALRVMEERNEEENDGVSV